MYVIAEPSRRPEFLIARHKNRIICYRLPNEKTR